MGERDGRDERGRRHDVRGVRDVRDVWDGREPRDGTGLADPAELDPAVMRKQYRTDGLSAADLAADPYEQFARWFADALRATAGGTITEPNAMVVATADPDGAPSARTVLLKGFDERGFVFFTNYGSRKGRELAANPRASLLFPWHPIARQVIVCGPVERVTDQETATYFHSRPRGSQLGAWASEQSSVLESRTRLEARYAEVAARWPAGTEVPVPPHWGGFRVAATTVEFWQGRADRLHDRLRYARGDGGWVIERLAP